MRVGYCSFEKFHNRKPGSIGSSKIRCRWLWENWEEAEEYVIGRQYDVLVFQKAYWIDFAKEFKGLKILDLCDPDWLDGAKVVEMIEKVDIVVTSTETLAEAVRRFTKKPVKTIPDRINFKEVPIRTRVHEGEAKKALWFGYGQNAKALDQTLDLLYEHNYELVVYADTPYATNKSFNLKITNVLAEGASFDSKLAELAATCDLLLNPKLSGERYKYKSNNKTLIGWALGLPIVDENPDDLVFFKSAEARNKEVEKRQKELVERWDVRLSVEDYKNLIKEAVNVKV